MSAKRKDKSFGQERFNAKILLIKPDCTYYVEKTKTESGHNAENITVTSAGRGT